MAIEIVDWGKHYENHRTKELKIMTWVRMSNRHDGDGYTQLLNHSNGAAHFGAWCALVELASRQHIGTTSANSGKYRDSAKYDASNHPHGRGILMRESGEPHDPDSLERMTRIPVSIWEEALPRLVTIGWIKGYKANDSIGSPSAPRRQSVGGISRGGAGECPMNGMEGKKRKKERQDTPPAAADAACGDDGVVFPEPEEKALAVKNGSASPLYHVFWDTMLKANGNAFSDYPKEGKCCQHLVKAAEGRARASPGGPDAMDVANSMLAAFWKLKQEGDKFWRAQPFTPSGLSPLWDRVLETMRADVISPDTQEAIDRIRL